MTRMTIASWDELCRFIDANKGKSIKLVPISWTGNSKVDRKTNEWTNDVDNERVWSVVFEVERG